MVNKERVKIGRNDPCHCGSGIKYKRCCLNKDKNLNRSTSNQKNLEENDELNKNKIKDIPSFQKMEDSIKGMEFLKSVTEIGLLDGLIPMGLDVDALKETLSEVDGFVEEYHDITSVPDKFNEAFLKCGWVFYMSMNHEVVTNSIKLYEQRKFNQAENILINYYDENIELFIQWLGWIDEFKPRLELIEKVYEDYANERYHACIPVLLAVIDGIVFDNKETGNKGFFGEENKLTAEDSIAAHITGLPELQKILSSPRTKTTTDELTIPYRNGILHGRDLNYANKSVAIKLWATLFALKDGLVEIKKSKEPKEEEKDLTFSELTASIRKNDMRETLLKKWKPRNLEINKDFPEFSLSSDYLEGSPERTLVEFFELWMKRNFGYMAQKMDHRTLKEYSIGIIAGKFSREIFNKKNLKSFKILEIIDEAPAISEIKTELVIEKKERQLKKEITFRIIYEDEKGQPEIRTMNNGSWKFISCFGEIDNI
ncbi:SEC-C motif domain protein [Methanobacterium lacus]|uniref:SEC-C motif domain protein n=1 Tax=Methanobacterium lacus (strain AL-21) TaxID=877455 RepID=F0T5W7_METLA|nr:SEC-C domain-containing protein [Methanobacterium lacus]ADZ09360.1 SEC-C motif domain protein [Methanobacterium lacus]